MIIDATAYVGPYPWRELPWWSAHGLRAAMDRVGIAEAWVSYLPGLLHQDPAPGNAALRRHLEGAGDRLRPVPTVQPDLPDWESDLAEARDRSAPAVRAWPMHVGLDPAGRAMRELAGAAGERGLVTALAVRLEDVRQRHPLDRAPDLPAAAVRALARVESARLLISAASRAFIEEVHFGLTDQEAERVRWDISWLWGPPIDEFSRLLETVGPERFVFGTGMPLRLPEAVIARLDLADLEPGVRAAVESGNLRGWGA